MPRNFRRKDHDIFSRFIFNPTLIRRDCGIAGKRGNPKTIPLMGITIAYQCRIPTIDMHSTDIY